MGAFENIIVGRSNKACIQKALCLLFIAFEKFLQERDIRELKIETGKLYLILMMHSTIGEFFVPFKIVDVIEVAEIDGDTKCLKVVYVQID